MTVVTVADGEGYQARIDGGVMSAQPVPVDLCQVLGWLQRKIVSEHPPLGLSGTFSADDGDSFVAFLEAQPGDRVETTPTQIRVVGVAPGPQP